jgi:hypothetical protein
LFFLSGIKELCSKHVRRYPLSEGQPHPATLVHPGSSQTFSNCSALRHCGQMLQVLPAFSGSAKSIISVSAPSHPHSVQRNISMVNQRLQTSTAIDPKKSTRYINIITLVGNADILMPQHKQDNNGKNYNTKDHTGYNSH